jgi:tetratricopeptide (TPR) repeat protein
MPNRKPKIDARQRGGRESAAVSSGGKSRKAILAACMTLAAGLVLLPFAFPGLHWRETLELETGSEGVPAQPLAVHTARGEPHPKIPARPAFHRAAVLSADLPQVWALRDESFDVAEGLVRALPGNPHALCLLGTVHHRHANQAEAMRLWEQCLQLDPQFADAHHSFGMWALKECRFSEAERHLREALRIDPAWDDVPLPLSEALQHQAKFQEAADILEAHVARTPQSAEAWWRLGQAYYQLQDYQAARRSFDEALETDPDHADACYGKAITLQKLGEVESARDCFERFRNLHSQQDIARRKEQETVTDEQRMRLMVVTTHMTAARVYGLHGMPAKAEPHWKRVAELDPQNRESRESLCELYTRQNRLDEALQIRGALCELEPENPRHWLSFGTLSFQSGQRGEAERAFRQVIELAPQKAEGYAALAQVQMQPDRDPQEAVKLAETAVDLAPTAQNHFVLARALWGAGHESRCRAALEQAIQLDPAEPRYREAYSRLQHEQ